MNVAAIMKSPRLKVKRANSHIDAIIRDSAPLTKDLYEITSEPARSIAVLTQPDCFHLAYRPKEPVTDHFGTIIGDAVNNLREALDYWANAALRAIGENRKVHFPFSKEWKNLETSRHYLAIQKSFPDAAEFILKTIKPCWDTNRHLWASVSLCNFNKHNDFGRKYRKHQRPIWHQYFPKLYRARGCEPPIYHHQVRHPNHHRQ